MSDRRKQITGALPSREAEPPASPQEMGGGKIVPIEPTEQMLDAAEAGSVKLETITAILSDRHMTYWRALAKYHWIKMLEAAPPIAGREGFGCKACSPLAATRIRQRAEGGWGMSVLLQMLRDWQDYCQQRPHRQQEAQAFKSAADEIERLQKSPAPASEAVWNAVEEALADIKRPGPSAGPEYIQGFALAIERVFEAIAALKRSGE